MVSLPEDLAMRAADVQGPLLAAGSGALRFRKELASQGVSIPDDADPIHRVAARHICALAESGDDGDGTGSVAPIYLRPPDAERWRERDTSQADGLRRAGQPPVRRLAYSDLPAVISIERRSFPTPWSLAMFVLELSKPSGICLAATAGTR